MHHEPTSASCISSACPTGKKTVATCYLRVLRPLQMMRHFLYGASSAEKSDAADKVREHLKCIMQMCFYFFVSPPAAIFSLTALSHLPCSEEKKKRKREREKLVHRLVSIFTDRAAFFYPLRGFRPSSTHAFFSSHVCQSWVRLTFAVGQTAVVAHGAEVLKYKHGYCWHQQQHHEHHHPHIGTEGLWRRDTEGEERGLGGGKGQGGEREATA